MSNRMRGLYKRETRDGIYLSYICVFCSSSNALRESIRSQLINHFETVSHYFSYISIITFPDE